MMKNDDEIQYLLGLESVFVWSENSYECCCEILDVGLSSNGYGRERYEEKRDG